MSVAVTQDALPPSPPRAKRGDKGKTAAPNYGQRVAALLMVGFAYTLFLLAVVSLPTRLIMLSGNAVREDLLAGRPVSNAQLDEFIKARERAVSIRMSGEQMDDLALATFQRAQRKGVDTPAGRAELMRALAWQESALARAPADSYGWVQLAYLLLQTEGIGVNAATALARSIETNPYEPRLMLARLNMAVLLMDRLDPDTRAKIPSMIRATWKLSPQELAKAANDNHYLSIVDSAFSDDTRALATFRSLVTSLNLPPAAAK